MDFHVGQKVVCVDGRRRSGYGSEALPKTGEVYTIRGFDHAAESIWLEEISNPPLTYTVKGKSSFQEPSFNLKCFRPVKTANIDVFLKMLEPQPVKELSHG